MGNMAVLHGAGRLRRCEGPGWEGLAQQAYGFEKAKGRFSRFAGPTGGPGYPHRLGKVGKQPYDCLTERGLLGK